MACEEGCGDFAKECGRGETEGESNGESDFLFLSLSFLFFLWRRQLTNRLREQIIDLSKEDVEAINGLDKNLRLCNKPDEKGTVWGWTMEQLGWD